MGPAGASASGARPDGRIGDDLKRIVAAVLIAAGLVFAAAVFLFLHAGAAIDERAAVRETGQVQRAFERGKARLQDDITSAAVGNEAYDRLTRAFDPAWANENLTVPFSRRRGHRVTVVVGADERLVYAVRNGQVLTLAEGAEIRAAAQPLIAHARAEELRKIAAYPQGRAFERAGFARGVIKIGDQLFMGAASTVAPEYSYSGPVAGRGSLVVSAIPIDAVFLRVLEANADVAGAELTTTLSSAGVSAPLASVDGEALGHVVWAPERPALRFLTEAWAAILAGAVLISFLLAALIFQVRARVDSLVQARRSAEAADEAKSDFLANMSHEIRTPLNGVLGMTQVMEADDLSAAQRERVMVIRESGRALLAILNDLLDLSKVEAGKLELELGQFDMTELASAVCSTFQGSAAARDLTLVFEITPQARGTWLGDALRLRQVLSNLVSNAIKFTHVGCVTLRIGHDSTGLTFAVEDTGIGMDAAVIPTLFQKFSQADASTARRYGGTGLGLSISRELIELMGGQMGVTSKLGEGSRFFFHIVLPRGESDPAQVQAAPVERAETSDQPLRILAAEDNPTNQLVLRALLQPAGVDVLIVGDGDQAVRAFEADRFDLVLMDVQMPLMNGVEATEAIREFEARTGRPRTPIIALSGNVMNHQMAEYTAAGMDGCVAKPIEVEKLFAAIEAALDGEPAAVAEAPETTTPPDAADNVEAAA